jgi:hypothetical protein
VGDVLTSMLQKASEKGHIKGILESFRLGGIMVLQYADDTLLFSSCGDREIRNLACAKVNKKSSWLEGQTLSI